MQIKAYALVLILALTSWLAEASTCLLSLSSQPQAVTELARLRMILDRSDPSDFAFMVLSTKYPAKEEAVFEELQERFKISREDFRKLLRQEIDRLQGDSQNLAQDEERRRDLERDFFKNRAIDGTLGIFHGVEPGPFMMGEVGAQVPVEITKPFEMMATPMTQVIWRKVAELANSRFGSKYKIDVDPSRFKGETRPVEQVSYDDVVVWINALNELSEAGESSILEWFPEHKAGDVYRLPTEAEWEFVVRGRGEYNGVYPFGNQASKLNEAAWFSDNSGRQTHPVCQMIKPIVIDGRKFHDMLGNVAEWVHDRHGGLLSGGKDPQGPEGGELRILRGGSYCDGPQVLRSAYRSYASPYESYPDVGFRLVRAPWTIP